jgi:hypothetical protein
MGAGNLHFPSVADGGKPENAGYYIPRYGVPHVEIH